MIYWIAVLIAWVVFHIPYRIRTIGRENLPKDRGYVLCPNHLSAIDPVFVVLARFWGKKMWVMAKEELFRNPVIAWFFGHVGVFPVARGRGDRSVLDSAIESVRNGSGMLIFPEGTRNKEGPGLLPLKSGAFVVAAAANADIVPCRIIYKGGHQHLFCTVTVIFGQPIPIESLGLGGDHPASKLREAKKVLAGRLEELYEQNRRYE